jgi:hypothetical protein
MLLLAGGPWFGDRYIQGPEGAAKLVGVALGFGAAGTVGTSVTLTVRPTVVVGLGSAVGTDGDTVAASDEQPARANRMVRAEVALNRVRSLTTSVLSHPRIYCG